MHELTPTTVWRLTPQLVLALDAVLGVPVDSYLNGSQTWLTDDGPGDITVEWRLHPVAGYQAPKGISHYDIWEAVVAAYSADPERGDVALGDERRALDTMWDGLECFPAYGDEVEPQTLAASAGATLGIAPDAAGLADHEAIAQEWEAKGGAASIVSLLIAQLGTG